MTIVCLSSAAPAHAQASVPDRGEGTLTLTFENYDVVGHFDVQGRTNTNGGTLSHALVTEFDYGVFDKFGLVVSLPFIASKYTGPPAYFVGPYLTHPGPLDDGTYHAAFQDVRLELRRQWWVGQVPVTPFVGFSFPTHDYETVGEAVPGRHRRDLVVGANAGADLDRIRPGSYVHARYAYGTMQKVDDIPFTRSNIDVDAGVAVTSRVLVRALVDWQIRHSGPTLAELAPDWVHHDRFIAPSYTSIGGGASVLVTRSTDVFAVFDATAAGSNGAHRQRTLVLGVSLSLRSRLHGLGGANDSVRQMSPDASRVMARSR
ncbi:MAG TPA: hypothetical protein VKE96_12845 [Vicinamibacterales bacterium]|nr:hypothetical protein [Vicinamibacterales bacterium]